MATSEIDGEHGIPRYVMGLSNESHQVLHGVGKRRISKSIKHSYTQRYARRVIKRLNKEEGKLEVEKRKYI